ncbi:MAG: transcription-repair coupling factor [Acidobacteria bacterium]|nr:MAG: transcription-repair coupling factor [Acidobacteriota bacterium]
MILPFVRELLAGVELTSSFQRAATHLKGGAGRIRVSGLTPTARALHYALLHRASARPLLLLVSDNRTAEELLPLLQSLCEMTGVATPDSVAYFPARDVLPFENLSPHPEIQEMRARALWRIASGTASLVVAPFAATTIRLRDAEYYRDLARTVRKGDWLDLESLVQHLNVVGYRQTDIVEQQGEYAQRGGILDVYSPEMDRPVRIELFGDEVESMRRFDPVTQRSATGLDEIVLLPLTETPVTEELLATINARLSGRRVRGTEEALEDAAKAGGVTVFPGWEFFAPVAGAENTIFDLIPEAAVVLDEPERLAEDHDAWWQRLVDAHEHSGIGILVRPEELYVTPEVWRERVAQTEGLDVEQLGLETSGGAELLQFSSRPTPRFHGAIPKLLEEVKKLSEAGERVLLVAGSMGELERLADIFNEYQVPYRLGTRNKPSAISEEAACFNDESAATALVCGYVPAGVALPDAKLVLFGANDIFDESEAGAARQQRPRSKTSAFLSDFRDLAVGDYVVHVEHGIGRYLGLREIPQADGSKSEFMVLEYAEGARLYVPLTRLDLVQKYRSAEGGQIVLNRLGTQQWVKTKTRVKKAMADMADELLKLYAQRKTAQGYQYSADTQFMREFEDAFEYNATDDQVAAVEDIKRDMESPQPMDRLLCGDVGYGKTEVAMRAAYKAVNDSRQVALLAPTTVLAFQHYETFKRRFAAFPVTIEMISRFRTAKQQKEIVEKVENGKVDILVGTHRVLSKDISFPDLGLVIIDEEQRFGVRHKERLKQLRKEVDVLTLSATPIPRTLHMSMLGLRDMSVIETPPRDRLAIQTVVAGWDEKLIRSAIEQELERGGQVYFVHNRIESIFEISSKLRELAPKARILVGHGQMGEGELEKVMLAFMRHEADILVATSIIENGLDIPLCNTIIINRADRHGLSELYQLRGRVGRSNRRSYAYLLVPPDRELNDLARRRLAALKEFSELGAGFKIAALDLELRGAGNLLGGQQSGHIEAVGFEMYTTMLEQMIRELKGEPVPEALDTALNLGLNIRIPNEYIHEENQRLRIYKRMAAATDEKQLSDVVSEMRDRYGEPPAALQHLVQYAHLRLECQRLGVASIERKRDQVSIKFTQTAEADPQKIMQLVARHKGVVFTPQGVLKFSLKATRPEEVLNGLRKILEGFEAEPTPA